MVKSTTRRSISNSNSATDLVKSTSTRSGKLKLVSGKLKLVLLLLLLVLLFIIVGEFYTLANPVVIKQFVLKFGLWAPIILILLHAFQSMLSIIPSQVTTVAAGFLFGPVLGVLYTLIGATIGSSVMFLISRKYGSKLALKFFNLHDLLHFTAFFKQKKSYALFLARIAPIFPNDVVSFAAGLTKISFGWFSLISTLGFIVQATILVWFGSELAQGQTSIPLIVVSILVGILIIIVLFKKQIRKVIIKDIHKIEKDLKQGVKVIF